MREGKMEAMQAEVSGLTVDELRANLVTLDYRGREFKELCLNRLLEIARTWEASSAKPTFQEGHGREYRQGEDRDGWAGARE